MHVGWNWYNFSDAPDLEVEFILESDNDGDNGDGVFIDDVRIVEGAFIGAMLSDFGLAATGTAENDNYVVMGGTSMSTPLTAGCAAIVRQFYQDELGLQYMSAALMRATIINGAVDITPGQYGVGANQEIAARPNNVEGWGRVDLSNTLFPPAPAQIDFKDELAGLNTEEQHEYVLNITDSTVPAVITMVYHDAPGANLVNHLDLTVIEPPGAGGGTLFPNGLAAADDQNNVEQIEIQNPQIGDYTIRIIGQKVNIGPQPYALVTRAGGTLADRDPIDIMLALDISGSMQDPASPGGESKLSVLQQAVELFIQLWTAMAVPGDHLGIAYFKTNVAEYKENGIVLLDVLEKAPNLVTDVNGQTTNWSNMTAMGGGLQMSIERLTDIDRFRNIILFTDGMQNVNPMVMEMAGGDFKIDQDPSVSQNSNVNPTAPPTQLDNNLGIKVNTIGVGATDPYMDLMEDIADSTNGLPKLTQAMDEDLRRFFVEDLIDALREHSPQLIGYRHGILSGDSASEAFTISKNAQKIIFKLSGVASDALNLQVFKNGQNMTEGGKMIIGPHYRIYAIDMPYKYKLNRVRAEGVWSMQISGKPGAKYEVAAIVEEPLLECDYRLDQQDYSVGQPLKLNVRLQFGNTPVTDATQVTATILRPKNSVGTLLSTNATPDPIGPNESGITPDLKKFQQLIKNERFYSSLQPDKLSIQLNNNGDGSYSAEYTNTYTPGVYTIVFKVSGVGTDIGSFYRTETRSTLVRFGLAEIAISKLVVKLINVTSGGKLFLLSVRPKDKFGNYLGPGYKDQIDFNVDDATSEDELEDLLDGRYAQKILVHADLKDPDLTIEVLGEDIYSGPMSDILPGKRWGVSLHGGTATARGVMNNNYNPGLLFMVDLSYRINPKWDLVAYAGYNAFKADTTAVDDTFWLNFSLNLKYHFMLTGSALMPYLQGGLGYYIPETGNSSIGVNLGFGLDFILTQSLVFEAGVNYHYLFKGNIEFLQAHGGLIFRF
ncbi:MAG: S8 family serine peptidase, partial [Desulfobacteraceae bacterium]|nr:S8 family serine peptidase [Desulfobacteraceae bacterium]